MTPPRTVSATDAAAIAADGVVFGYPLVLMNYIREWMTAAPAPDPARMRAPANRFVHARALPPAACGRPGGARTGALRSSAWLDLAATPVVLSVPETHGRFYALSLVDLWTNVFASVVARTTGTGPGRAMPAAGRNSNIAAPPSRAPPAQLARWTHGPSLVA